jgi:formylglycine-generating enzyme required for sulfatase activity
LETVVIAHPYNGGAGPAWADAWGEDRFGLFAEVEVKGVTFRFRWIPPGSFEMGSPPDEEGRDSDEAQHTVVLNQGYWLGETPVTQAQWEAVMGQNPSRFSKGGAYPVESVRWDDCTRFCEVFQSLSPGPLARLPSEAEWEYACRALTTGPRWDTARPLGDLAWYTENSGGQTHPVAEKLPNPWGLYDMLGNVWEWCADLYADYPPRTMYDPYNVRGEHRVYRGGSWNFSAPRLRAAVRYRGHPGSRWRSLGVRLARGPALQPSAEPQPS